MCGNLVLRYFRSKCRVEIFKFSYENAQNPTLVLYNRKKWFLFYYIFVIILCAIIVIMRIIRKSTEVALAFYGGR